MSDSLCWGLALSRAGAPVLERLDQAGLLGGRLEPGGAPSEQLSRHWAQASAFVVVGACGAVTRLVAPLLVGKHQDPAVVVVDPQGRFAVPLLGGHGAGAEQLSQRVAALLGGKRYSRAPAVAAAAWPSTASGWPGAGGRVWVTGTP